VAGASASASAAMCVPRRAGRTWWWEGRAVGASAAASAEAGDENVVVGGARGGCECGAAASVRCERCKKGSWPFVGRGLQASRRTWVLALTRASPGPGTLPRSRPLPFFLTRG
jgi:hypothetical protein